MATETGDRHTASAGSKVILLGEHAVVHGSDALVLGLPNGVQATIGPAETKQLSITPWTLDDASKQQLQSALDTMQQQLGAPMQPLRIAIEAVIPPRSGMGASAAVGLSCARAMSALFRLRRCEDDLFMAVKTFEDFFHQKSSGVDVRAVANSGCARFRPPHRLTPIPCKSIPLMVVHSGYPGATRTTVNLFQERLSRHPDAPTQLQRLASLVNDGETAIRQQHWAALGELMNTAHCLLSWFGVSTDSLNEICAVARDAGALGAKLTGGGGGGCAIVLVEANKWHAVATALQNRKFDVVM
ncbi:MAG: mevalonate kinase [Deltaproteobacteria bacterium]|nr:mevalonate kinase [Deltaproteobacteria bacterium]MBN2672825.1 mevalonate kinase [Deltaproteobacteria bacterium]